MESHIESYCGNVSRWPCGSKAPSADDEDAVDWRLLPSLSFLYLMCSLDKSNASNAKVKSF
jgi:hypothetical protein